MVEVTLTQPAGIPVDGDWIVQALHDAAWWPSADRSPVQPQVTDWLDAGGAVLIWVRVAELTMLVAGRRDGGVITPVAAADAVSVLASRASWPTGGGGVVRWNPPVRLSVIGRVDTASTNDVLHVRSGGNPAVLKVYRLAGDGRSEDGTLSALAPTGLVPRPLARLGYRAAGGAESLLALVLEVVPGTTFDVPLRHGLEAAWRRGDADLTVADRDVLRRVREATRALHEALVRAPGGFDRSIVEREEHRPAGQAGRLRGLLADLEVVRDFARGDSAHRLVDRAAVNAQRLARPMAATGPAHGDLHLSNVLVSDERIRFIDVAGTESALPADDFAALWRGAECMCLDLQVARVGGHTGSPDEVAAGLRQAAFTAASGGDAEAALFAPLTVSAAGGEGRIWDRWCASATAELTASTAAATDRLPYLARLVHDLRYHSERERTYYADLAWWHLARWCLAGAGRPKEKS